MGPIEVSIKEKIVREALLAILLDPAKVDRDTSSKISKQAKDGGADLVFIGGSVGAGYGLNDTIKGVKEGSDLPVILFPGNVDGISPLADALLFMSLLNSSNPYWIIQAQALAAPVVRRMGIEAIPTAYLILEPGEKSAAGWVGWVNPIPRSKPEIALAYSMAAELLGIRWVYLEAGSGAEKPVPTKTVLLVSENTSLGVIVGGGIKSPELVRERVNAGADIIVIGTHIEEGGDIASKVEEMKRETIRTEPKHL